MSSASPTESDVTEQPSAASADGAVDVASESPALPRDDGRSGASWDGSLALAKRMFGNGRFPIELVILVVLAAITRFVNLYDPHAIVFDETYFREYALHYQTGTYYFDLHPPLGKLLLGIWGMLAGIDANPMSKTQYAVGLRVLPAFAGTLVVPVVYVLFRHVSRSRIVGTLGAAFILMDNAILAESRFTFMDSMLLLFGLGAVTCALIARDRTDRSHWGYLTAAGVLAGMAVTTKLTGASILGLLGLLWLFDLWKVRPSWQLAAKRAGVLAAAPVLVYVLTFAVHLTLLTKSGPGDGYMSTEYQQVLKGNPQYKPDAHFSIVHKFEDLNHSMHVYEIQLNGGTHPSQSKWWSWPLDKRPVFLYYGASSDNKGRYIYTLGNPAVWWGALLAVAVTLVGIVVRRRLFWPYRWPLTFLFIAWMANFLPFALIKRPMFIYHYFYGLVFSLGFGLLGIAILLRWVRQPEPRDEKAAAGEHASAAAVEDVKSEGSEDANTEGAAADPAPPESSPRAPSIWSQPAVGFAFPTRWSAAAFWGILALVTLSFLYFSPITFGIPLTQDGLDSRMWLHTWR